VSASATLPCPRCGAALPVDPTAATTTCVYCRTTVAVPPWMRQGALEYAARVGAVQHRAEASRQAIGMYAASAGYSKSTWKIVLGVYGVTIGTSILASVLPHGVAEHVLPVLAPILIYGTMGYFGVRYYRAYQRAKQPGGASLGVATSTCERCGGPLTFQVGSARAVCHACNAVAVAGRTMQGDLVSVAERQARDLEVARARSERQMYRASSGVARFTRYYMFFAMGWPVAALIGVGLIGGTVQIVEGLVDGRPREVQGGVVAFLVGLIAAAVAGGVGAIVHARVIKPARAGGPVLRALAAHLSGRVVESGTTAALDWLDTCWWGPAPHETMLAQQETARYTLATAIDGLPALLVVIGGGTVSGKRLHVLVAAPRARDERVLSTRPGVDLRCYGFDVSVSEDGVALSRATADPAVVNEASLTWALHAAAALARA
jgi:hypothetical protein